MASSRGVQDGDLVNVQLQWEGNSSDIFMEANEMRQLPAEALTVIKKRAEEILQGSSLRRLTYVDDDGDHCTLTEGSVNDALTFATCVEGIWLLPLFVHETPAPARAVSQPAPPAAPTAAAEEPEEPAAPPTPPRAPAEPPAPEEPPAAPAEREAPAAAKPPLRNLEVHMMTACDGCDQSPILGKRFKCLECHDYDLCERCFKINRTDLSVHGHQTWARIQADSHVLVEADDDEVPVCHVDITCDGCKASPIVGSRFKCTTVPNYDLCARCYARRKEISPHSNEPFEELVVPPTVPSVTLDPVVQAVPAAPRELESKQEEPPSLSASEGSSAESAQSEAESKPEEPPPLSALESSSALKVLAFHLDDDLCLLALEALMKHPNERLRAAAAQAAEAAASAPAMEPASPLVPVPEPEALLAEPEAKPELEAKLEPEAVAEEEPTPEVIPAAIEVEEDQKGLNPESVSMVVDEDQAPEAKLSATILSSSQLVLGVEASEDESARGDVTKEEAELLQQVPSACQAYRCGRIVLPTSAETGAVPAEAKLIVRNDGDLPWPELTCLSIIVGDPLGLASMPLGPMQPGEAAEVIMDLAVPQKPESGILRSIWSMVDAATGESFGPLIFFEVVWMQM